MCGSPESAHTSTTSTKKGGGGGSNNQVVRGARAISQETRMKGHLGGTGANGRQLTSGKGGSKEFVPEGSPPSAQKGAWLNALEGWLLDAWKHHLNLIGKLVGSH